MMHEKNIDKTVDVLNRGGVVIIPTDTIPGIATHYLNVEGLKRIVALKKRPKDLVFPLLIGDISQISLVASKIPEAASKFMRRYWPGGLTIIIPAKRGLPSQIVSKDGVGVRMPNYSPLLKTLRKLGAPIAATSINISGEKPIINLKHIPQRFVKGVDFIWSTEEPCQGLPSTVIAVDKKGRIRVVRQGSTNIDSYLSKKALP